MQCNIITKMIRFQELKPIVLPSNFFEKDVEAKVALLILVPSTKIIQIILLKRPIVWKVAIQMAELSPDFLQELDRVFRRCKLQTCYSTGVVLLPEFCAYDSYFTFTESSISAEQVTQELSAIKGVSNVEMTKVST